MNSLFFCHCDKTLWSITALQRKNIYLIMKIYKSMEEIIVPSEISEVTFLSQSEEKEKGNNAN